MLLPLALFAAAASARVYDKLSAVPEGWTEIAPALPTDILLLRIALRQQHAEALEQAVMEMSTPGHSNYGQHMSREELRSFTAPSQIATESVIDWLHSLEIHPEVDNDWMVIRTSVEKAEKLLDTTFAWYQNENGGKPQLRSLSYSVPDSIADYVNMIQPTTRFGQMAQQRSTIFKATHMGEASGISDVVDAVSCTTVTPACLKSLYNIGYTPTATGNLVGVCSYLDEYARFTDLSTFERLLVPQASGQSFAVQEVNGGLNDQNSADDSTEANLDVQYVLGVSNPIPILEYSTGGLGPLVPTQDEPTQPGSNEPYLDFLNFILAQPDSALPQTLTTSYGEEEQSVPASFAIQVCNMFMQLGARGVSVLFSSGDSGPGNSCVRNTDQATFFNPTFPAGCPFVTAVGAVTGTAPERAVSFSSGGFSILHARPSYQSTAVPAYLAKIGNTYAQFFNASGRGIPDVAAQGQNFEVVDKGREVSVAGTSCSSPTFAGVVALLNAARKSIGQAPLGFLNPFLYANPSALTDITTGNSVGCTSNPTFGRTGAKFNATAGWDPVTGLGTPLFDRLLALAAPGVANS